MSKKPIVKSSAKAGNGQIPNLSELEKILELMGRHQVAELEWDSGATKLHLRTQASFVAAPASNVTYAAPQAAAVQTNSTAKIETPAAAPQAVQQISGKQVLSPFVGTFYRSSSPGSPPYVKEGQSVKSGDVLCIVEAMKLMNEIESDFSGKIVSILVENGQPVEFGEPLFIIET